jgi:hypothetical protein
MNKPLRVRGHGGAKSQALPSKGRDFEKTASVRWQARCGRSGRPTREFRTCTLAQCPRPYRVCRAGTAGADAAPRGTQSRKPGTRSPSPLACHGCRRCGSAQGRDVPPPHLTTMTLCFAASPPFGNPQTWTAGPWAAEAVQGRRESTLPPAPKKTPGDKRPGDNYGATACRRQEGSVAR